MKNVIITGAAGNLGKASVDKFLKDGYHVMATVSPGKELDIKAENITVFEVDLSNESASSNFVKEVITRFEQVDVVLLLVGVFSAGDIFQTDGNALHKMFALNFETAYYTVRPVFEQMMKQPSGGRIIFVGSRPSLVPEEGRKFLAYSLSKSLLFRLAEYLNAQGSANNVVASVIVPGVIDTPANRKAIGGDRSKWVSPEEIAEIISFIVSDTAKSMNEPVVKLYGNL
jgi:NAD(P)-dependent dehydrogenase (short-subunit alcohol dehydrogenase family)